MSSTLVVNAIRNRLLHIQACYEVLLARNPALAGKILVEFKVETDGSFREVWVTENTSGNPVLGCCVTENLYRAGPVSPGPTGGPVYFRYPFVFAPQN